MKTLIIVILILVCLLTTPLSLKRVLDRGRGKGWPNVPATSSGTSAPKDTGRTDDAREPASTISFGAEDPGISFAFLGEKTPLRREVTETADRHPKTLFPVIISVDPADGLDPFDRCRNLLPVFRLGKGPADAETKPGHEMYGLPTDLMKKLSGLGLPFGVSITVTRENLREMTSRALFDELQAYGCALALYFEYAAAGDSTDGNPAAEDPVRSLAPDEADRALMELRLQELQETFENIIFLAFPSDEKTLLRYSDHI